MKRVLVLMLTGIALTVPTASRAEVAGSSLLAVSTIELRQVAHGWSAKRQVLGQTVIQRQSREDRHCR